VVSSPLNRLDDLADLVIHQSIGDTLGAAVGVN